MQECGDDAAVVLAVIEGEVAPEQLRETCSDGQRLSFAAIIVDMMLSGKSSSGSADSFTTTRLSCGQSWRLTHSRCGSVVTTGVCASAGVLPFNPSLGFTYRRRCGASWWANGGHGLQRDSAMDAIPCARVAW